MASPAGHHPHLQAPAPPPRRPPLEEGESRNKKMADAADSGGSDWEVVSLTASTYAAAPGPISPIHAADKTESPLLLPNPPAPPAHFFMSQHFNLPPGQPPITHLENSGRQELESGPAVADGDAADADHLDMPSPENLCEGEREDVLVLASPAAGNGLQVEGGGGGEELQQTTTLCSLPDVAGGGHVPAADATDATAAGSASLPTPAATVPVAAPSGGVGACNAAHAWWEKTFSFPRDNGTQPLAFRFVFVAGKLQLQEDHLSSVPELAVHSQTQKVSCAVNEPLGQAKGSMLGGGSPVAQQG